MMGFEYLKTAKGEYLWHAFILKLPKVGDLVTKVAVARFCRTLGTMVSSGVPILDGLDICSRTAGNRVIENAVLKAKDSISEGRNISEPLMESGVFPEMVCQMISVGENTGALDIMLNKIADFYEDEVDQAVENAAMIEPIIMVFLGGVVGGFIIAMYLPIFSMANQINRLKTVIRTACQQWTPSPVEEANRPLHPDSRGFGHRISGNLAAPRAGNGI